MCGLGLGFSAGNSWFCDYMADAVLQCACKVGISKRKCLVVSVCLDF